MKREENIVTVDVGGTHARFAIAAIAANGAIELSEAVTLHTKDHASFQTAWEHYRDHMGGTLPDAVAMALAAPVTSDVIRFTNNPWIIRPALIAEKLGCSRHVIVNDFEAVAHAVARVSQNHFVPLCGPDKSLPEKGIITVRLNIHLDMRLADTGESIRHFY